MKQYNGLVSLLVLVTCVVGVCVPSISAQAPDQTAPDLTLLWSHVHAQPQDFAAVCVPTADPGRAVFYNAFEPFPLASVSKLLLMIEYARRVDSGLLSLSENVAVATLRQYDLPATNAGAHDRFMATYPAGTQAISLWDVAAIGMIQYSSNAASDYMLQRLDPIDWKELYGLLRVEDTGVPHPLGMIPLLMNNHEDGQPSMAGVKNLTVEQGTDLFRRYIMDPTWRAAEIAYRSERQRSFPGWDIQAAVLQQATVTGSADDFMRVLLAIYGDGDALSGGVKGMVRLALRWQENDFINTSYVEYGSKLGYYSGGTLSLVAYGQPVDSSPVISVIFMRNIPRTTYNDLLRGDSIGDLAHWLNFNQCAGLRDALRPKE